ncbi:MAG TPA: glycosyltransferase family 87 protein [Anaerolineales bacterium]
MHRPFSSMRPGDWQNLAILSLAFFWIAQVAFDLAWGNVFGRFASDAASFWSAGYIANHYGYAGVYDLDLMAQTQHPLLPEIGNSPFVFHPIPTPYLPFFILPFQLLSLFPPVPAALAWVIMNALGSVLYLLSFARRATGVPPRAHLIALLMVSAPVFLNLFTGQVSLLLMIGAGEFLLAARGQKPLHAGLWLGCLLIKPQSLVLLVPALLLQRQFRMLLGLAVSSVVVVGTSLLLAGPRALMSLAQLWLGYAAGAGLPTNDVSLMMNWRMIGLQLATVVQAEMAWGVAFAGLALTAIAALGLWLRPLDVRSTGFLTAALGVLAATGSVAWHSHVPAAMLVIPVVLVLYVQHRELLGGLLEWWALMPAGLYFVRLLLASMMHAGVLAPQVNGFLDLLAGIGLFIMNLVMLLWALRHARPFDSRPESLLPASS